MTRDALADVLAALTADADVAWWRTALADHAGRRGRFSSDGVLFEAHPLVRAMTGFDWLIVSTWRVTDPDAAIEVLRERGLWPWDPCDVHAPGWWCKYRESNHVVADVVAVAALGCETIKAAIELAGVLAPGYEVVWRVLDADEFLELVPLQWVDVGAPKAAVEADRALRSLGVRVEHIEAKRLVLAVEACR
jgi:hypothetical protein